MNDKNQTNFFTNNWGTYSATFYSPTKVEAAYPTIAFVHGFGAREEWYSWIGRCFASQGYAALLFTVPSSGLPNPYQWSDGIKSAIDLLLDKIIPSCDITCSKKIGVMGHSMGGLGAIIAASQDQRIKCTVGLAPAIIPRFLPITQEIKNISTPIQLQIGSKDGLIDPKNVKAFLTTLNSQKKSYIEIEGGNHIRFMDKAKVSIVGEYISRSGLIGTELKDLKADITFEEQHRISSNSFIEWFDNSLKD